MHQKQDELPDVDTIVVPFDELVEALRFNENHSGREYAQLKISPPFEGDIEANRVITDRNSRYPPELDPEPKHYGPQVFFEGGGVPTPPQGMLNRSHAAMEMDIDDPSEDAIDEVQQIHEENWRRELKQRLDETPDVFADAVDVEYVFDNSDQ